MFQEFSAEARLDLAAEQRNLRFVHRTLIFVSLPIQGVSRIIGRFDTVS